MITFANKMISTMCSLKKKYKFKKNLTLEKSK